MHPEIAFQPRGEQHLARWKELQAMLELAKLPFKIETDRFDRLLMSPLPAYCHTRYVGKIMKLLNKFAARWPSKCGNCRVPRRVCLASLSG